MGGLGQLSLKKRRLRRDLIAISCHLKEGPREDGAKFFSEACSDKTRRNGYDLQQSKFSLSVRESSSALASPSLETFMSIML